MRRHEELKLRLDSLARSYGKKDLNSDPALFLHRYRNPLDQEIVGFIASALAYGNVKQIRQSVEKVLPVLGDSPRKFIERFDLVVGEKKLRGFKHRFNDGRDMASLLFLIRQLVKTHGTIGEFFAAGWKSEHGNVREALISFIARIESLDPGPFYGGRFPALGDGVRFFLSSPREGSACKRLCMYLRWMVRKDEVDLGLWTKIPSSALVMPIDTHIARISHKLRLIHLPNATWKIAEELTKNLQKFSPEDPVKYDFALSRIGILEGWPRKTPRELAAKEVVALTKN